MYFFPFRALSRGEPAIELDNRVVIECLLSKHAAPRLQNAVHFRICLRQIEVMQHTAAQNYIERIIWKAGVLAITFNKDATLGQAIAHSHSGRPLDRDVTHIDPYRKRSSHPSRLKSLSAVTAGIVQDDFTRHVLGQPLVAVVVGKLSRGIPPNGG